jgi:hypothetical protein
MARTSAATQSTAAQKGGHHRVFVTNCVRYCQASLIPCAANPATRNHADPGDAHCGDDDERRRNGGLDGNDLPPSVGDGESDVDGCDQG